MDRSTTIEVLSRCELLTVYRCASGCVHVRIGTVTLNLTSDEFGVLVKGVGEALVRLSVRDTVDAVVATLQ